MTHRTHSIIALSLALLLNACGSGSTSSQETPSFLSDDTGFSSDEKAYLYRLFSTEYLWYDQVAQGVDVSAFSQPQEMIDALKVTPPDKWSFTLTQQQYDDEANQKTAGFGFGYTTDFTLYQVYSGSPAEGKLQRGDRLLELNHEAITSTLISQAKQNLKVPSTFTLLRDGTQIDVEVIPDEYTYRVSQGKVFDYENKKIGYLFYDAFTQNSAEEFEHIFTTFSTEGIEELVIDLRYNGGGSLTAASALLDNITNAHAGQRQMFLDWNDQYKRNNESYLFEDASMQDGNELSMKRVFFLVTKDSASASEAVINALVPYLGERNVITIGDDTHGKPVGMSGRVYGSNYYFIINFFVKNSAEETTSFDGITSTCKAEDDITHQLGDTEETMLKATLQFMTTGVCPTL